MNEHSNCELAAADELCRMNDIFAAQKVAFDAAPYPSARLRREKLRALKRQLCRYQDVLADAMSRDFGFRAPAESRLFDLLGSVLEINHLVRHVGRWMRRSHRHTELLFFPNPLSVMYQPKGIVGVIVPWNFPVYLAVGPLAAALAAGNRVMIKMPETTPATADTLARLLGDVFREDEVAVISGRLSDPNTFTALPFNHIVFTGSPAVGRKVMETAARNVTPITLELGGKSPAIVAENYPVEEAARRIMHGKSANCGQVCVAPDYVLVPHAKISAFATAAKAQFEKLYGTSIRHNDAYTSVASDRQLARLNDLLADARQKGATIVPCAPYEAVRDGRRMPVHLLLHCRPDMKIMQEEIFGPLLPVVEYDSMADAIRRIVAGQRPLALYLFSAKTPEVNDVLQRTHAGGVTLNDWGWHVVNHDAPFGGVGNSGMGSYHGVEGFRELSHGKTVLKKYRWFPIDLFYPPYGSMFQRLTLKFFLGAADPGLKDEK